jgi:acyl-[acyl-carrier-protein]-phospholipid O-acyltransferase/long-chain-fatty-acid--[acyl-carrier-protein] ligase
MIAKLGWNVNTGAAGPRYVYIEDVMREISGGRKARIAALTTLLPCAILERTLFRRSAKRLDELATLMFTSGSTGVPKGVMLTQGNVLSNLQAITMILNLTPADTILGVLPFFHSFGFTAGLWFPLVAGFKGAYHTNPLDTKTVGELCRTERVTFLVGTPTFLSAYARRIDKDDFASLRFAVAGAEKLRPELAKAFEDKFNVPLLEGYGCTELSPVVALNLPNIVDGDILQVGRKVGKIGRPIPGVSVKIVDPDSYAPLAPGERGLLLVKGPNVMKGYLNDPVKTAEAIRDGWYVTGDIAVLDEDGFLEITDRLSRFSKIGGEMVPHILIEQKLHELAKAVDRLFVVTSVPDVKKGEALAVLTAGFTGDLDALWKELNGSDLPKLWLPDRDRVIQLETLPLLGSGKLDMPQIKKIALDRTAT